ncbi:hypothetical protein FJZ53_00615 [Candidatus Woesearchaeota archaeon]|nr:hypothetical protein [Candidatus Woesearchaeota archaeon]
MISKKWLRPLGIITLFITASVLFFLSGCSTQDDKQIVGGPCAYDAFLGKCTITSVGTDSAKFKFKPGSTMDLSNVGFIKNEQEVTSREYGEPLSSITGEVKDGSVFSCQIKLITEGTCTPIMFVFY